VSATPRPAAGARWRAFTARPENLLLVLAAAVPFSFQAWRTLLNNFAVERAAFGGAEIGVLQSLREVPGFLAFTFVVLVALMREQRFAYLSLAVLGVGVALTGYFPSVVGLYLTTVLMSVGFHYYETAKDSLALQWVPKADTPRVLGRLIGVGAAAAIASYGVVFVARNAFGFDYRALYLLSGGLTLAILAGAVLSFPTFEAHVSQRRSLVLRRRYWLYYLLTFLGGGRRQIFTVFATFLMVERFGYTVDQMVALFLVTSLFNIFLAPRIGGFIARFGERRMLTFEYVGLVGVFLAYSVVTDHRIAAALFLVDHVFFAFAIGMKTYFQKIADPGDLASTAGVAFTINHIAAVVLPALFGALWLVSPAYVFQAGAGMAVLSLVCARLVPRDPGEGCETIFSEGGAGERGPVTEDAVPSPVGAGS